MMCLTHAGERILAIANRVSDPFKRISIARAFDLRGPTQFGVDALYSIPVI